MSDRNTKITLTLSDLHQIGREGGATAHLETGEEVELLAAHATVNRKGYVEGVLQPVKVVLSYSDIYPQIRTIKRYDVLIARRVKEGRKTILKSTGRGYHREKN